MNDDKTGVIWTVIVLGVLVTGVILIVTPNPTGIEAGGGPMEASTPAERVPNGPETAPTNDPMP